METKKLEIELLKKFNRLFEEVFENEPNFKLKIRLGSKRSISLHETVISIPEIYWELRVFLTGEEDISWLESELTEAEKDPNKFNEWIGDWTFEDRQAINERYGF